jgi:ADP-heptose:LPS heptosyltransferase
MSARKAGKLDAERASRPVTRARDSVQRILIVALDNLGDLVFASALAPPLHDAFPGATIDVWCKEYTAPIAPLIPFVHDVIAADPFWAVPAHRPRPPMRPFLRSVAAVRQRGYDVAILTGAPWRTAAAVAATGIRMRVGLSRHHNSRFLTHVLPAEDQHKPVLLEQARLLATLSVESPNPRYKLDATPLDALRRDLAGRLPSFIALHPFAADSRRCVALDEWVRVAHVLDTRGLTTLWIGTSRELDDLRNAGGAVPGHFIDRLGDGSLTATATALSLAMLFVGHDSGPLHLANAFGTPVVGVFAPGQPERTFPQGTGPSRMLYSPSPTGIDADQMLREIDALLVSSAR